MRIPYKLITFRLIKNQLRINFNSKEMTSNLMKLSNRDNLLTKMCPLKHH